MSRAFFILSDCAGYALVGIVFTILLLNQYVEMYKKDEPVFGHKIVAKIKPIDCLQKCLQIREGAFLLIQYEYCSHKTML